MVVNIGTGGRIPLNRASAAAPCSTYRGYHPGIRVARFRVSEHDIQAAFAGGGIAYADRLIKDLAMSRPYVIKPGSIVPRGSDEACHPVAVPSLSMALSGERLGNEVGVRAAGRGPLAKGLALMRTRGIVLLGWFLMKFGIRTGQTDWGRYKETLVSNTDVRKFVDIYRQVLAGTEAQRNALAAWLEERYARGELIYGLHVTDRAHMTCLVFNYAGRHLHFIDGADGGFFLASRAFKERAARFAAQTR